MPYAHAFTPHSPASPCTVLEITSAQNPRFKSWLKCLDGKGIRKTGEALFAGKKFLDEVLEHHPQRVRGIIARSVADAELLRIPPGCTLYILPADLFAQLDIYGINAPLLLVSAPPLEPWDGQLAPGITVFLPFQNPINLGTTIRTAAALGAQVVLLQEAATPYLPKSLRASGPSIFQTSICQGPSLKELAAYSRLPLYALSPRGENIFTFSFPQTLGLVAGMEGPGLDEHWPESSRLSIPMQGQVESLNAAIAVAMAMACHWSATPAGRPAV